MYFWELVKTLFIGFFKKITRHRYFIPAIDNSKPWLAAGKLALLHWSLLVWHKEGVSFQHFYCETKDRLVVNVQSGMWIFAQNKLEGEESILYFEK